MMNSLTSFRKRTCSFLNLLLSFTVLLLVSGQIFAATGNVFVVGNRFRNCGEFDNTYNGTYAKGPPPLFRTFPPSTPPTYSSGVLVSESLQQQSQSSKPNGLDILVAIFFFIAATWLILAVFYALLALLVLRLRARGQLDIYEENFGRLQCFGAFYVPLGCILRRYVVALGYDQAGSGGNQNGRGSRSYHFITRQERRLAVESLLSKHKNKDIEDTGPGTPMTKEMTTKDFFSNNCEFDADNDIELNNNMNDLNQETPMKQAESKELEGTIHFEIDTFNLTTDEPVCSICLEKYEDAEENNDEIYSSRICSHRFHTACILEWLERRSNTECPCCRVPLVTDEQVWQTVKQIRRANRKMLRKSRRRNWLASCGSYFVRHLQPQTSLTPDVNESNNIDVATSPPSLRDSTVHNNTDISSEVVSLESSSAAEAAWISSSAEERGGEDNKMKDVVVGLSSVTDIGVATSLSLVHNSIVNNASVVCKVVPSESPSLSEGVRTFSSTGSEDNQLEEDVMQVQSNIIHAVITDAPDASYICKIVQSESPSISGEVCTFSSVGLEDNQLEEDVMQVPSNSTDTAMTPQPVRDSIENNDVIVCNQTMPSEPLPVDEDAMTISLAEEKRVGNSRESSESPQTKNELSEEETV